MCDWTPRTPLSGGATYWYWPRALCLGRAICEATGRSIADDTRLLLPNLSSRSRSRCRIGEISTKLYAGPGLIHIVAAFLAVGIARIELNSDIR